MKMRFLLATTSVLVMAGAVPAGAEKIGIGVLDPQATLHVTGDSSSDSDVIIENLDASDGAADNEGVLLIDTDDGHRMKTVPLTDLIGSSTDTTVSNTGTSLDGGTNVLTISDETGDVTVDLSALSDTDTTIPSPWYGTDDKLPATDNTEDMYASGSIIIGQGEARSDLTINDSNSNERAGFVIAPELVPTSPSAKYFAWASNLGGRDRARAAGQSSTGSEVRMLVDEIWDDVYFRALHSAGRQIDVSANSVATRLAMTDDAANTANIYAEDGFIGINAADPLTPLQVNALPQDNAAPSVVFSDALGNFSYADATVFTSAANDTTVSNTDAAFDGATNVLTITDETGYITVDLSALPDGTTPLTPEELENLALAQACTAGRAPEGRLFLIETWDAPGSRPSRRSDFRLPEGARRLDNPAAFGLGQIPEGHVPYLAPQGTIHLFKDPRGASTFAPSALNPK